MPDDENTAWPERFCAAAVWSIMTVILLFLSAVSMVVTCTVYGAGEVIRYGADRPLFHALFLLLVLTLLLIMRRRGITPWNALEKRRKLFGMYMLAGGAIGSWLLLTCFLPVSDQRLALEASQALLEGNYTPWAPWGFRYASPEGIAGYAYTYPSQNGLILFFAMVSFLFADAAPYALQVINLIFLFLGIRYLCRLYSGIFRLPGMWGTGLLMLGFLPFTFYITFVYGTIPGFALSSMALYYEHRFIEKGRWKYFFAAAVSICAAILLKSNYLIVLVAMVIYLLTRGVFYKAPRFAAAAAAMILLYAGSGLMLNQCIETITDMPVSKGSPMLAWVEMGLQEGRRGPGWYNSYNIRVFSDNDLDSERTLHAVKADLGETIRDFAANPSEAKEFFLKKTASIWAEPTFQSLWIQEIKGDSWVFPNMTQSLFQEEGVLNRVYVMFFNYMQTLSYLGALLFLILMRRRITWPQLMPAMVFIGGFLFHMAWEAKGQYSVCYFLLLIPYAVLGLREAVGLLDSVIDTFRRPPQNVQ